MLPAGDLLVLLSRTTLLVYLPLLEWIRRPNATGDSQGRAAGIRQMKHYGNKTYSVRKMGKRLEKSTAKDLEMAIKDTKRLNFTSNNR